MIEKPLNPFTIANELGYYEYAPHPVTGETVRKVDWGRMCTHENINIWAKNKPVRFPKNEELTESQMHRQPIDETYHGIYIKNSSSPITLRALIFGIDSVTHEYRRPRGGANEPFRISDFNNYQSNGGGLVTTTGASNALNQEKRVNVGGAFATPATDVWMTYGGIEPMETDYLVAKSDVYPSGFVYRGIMLTYNGQSYYKTGVINWNDSTLKTWLPAGTNLILVEAMEFVTNIEQATLRNATNIPSGAFFYAVLKDNSVPFTANPYSIYVNKTLAPGSIRYRIPVPFTAIHNSLSNRIEFTLTFDASVPEAGGGSLVDIEIILVRNSDNRWMSRKSLGNYSLSNNEVKVFNGFFTEPYLGMRLIVIERKSNIAESDIIQQT